MRLTKRQLASEDGVIGYLTQFGPLDPAALLAVAREAFEEFNQRKPLRAEVAEIPFALGWAHAFGWLPQQDIDTAIEVNGCDGDVILMKWEDGRCEALESVCRDQKGAEAIWQSCRIGRSENTSSTHH